MPSVLLLAQLGCGEPVTLPLGQGDPRPRFLTVGRPISILNSEGDDENPTLTQDMLQIYFTSEREDGLGKSDVWCAERSSRTEPFGEPHLVMEASSEEEETSSAISADGKTLWVGSKRPVDDADDDDDINIWRLRRENKDSDWSPPEFVTELNSPQDDIPRPVALDGTVMPMASRRDKGAYKTFLARRATSADEFSSDLEPITEIEEAGLSAVDAFMTNDGLLLFFNRADDDDDGRLYLAWRRSPEEPFIEALPLDIVNTTGGDVRDPWINDDGTRFFFTSNGSEGQGELDIYMAFIELPTASEIAAH